MTDWSPMEPKHCVDDVFVLGKVYSVFFLLQNECTYQMYLPIVIHALFAVCSFRSSRVVFINETLKGGFILCLTFMPKRHFHFLQILKGAERFLT